MVDPLLKSEALARLLSTREAEALERAWDEGYDAAESMARCWGPSNPYRTQAVRGG